MGATKDATRRLAGWIRLAAWCTLLYLIHSPWRELGGLVTERLRWSERFVLPMGLTIGCYLGALGCRHAFLMPAALTAVALVVLRVMGSTGLIGVVFIAFAAYCAGIDIAGRAYPLMMGKRDGRPSEGNEPPPWLGV